MILTQILGQSQRGMLQVQCECVCLYVGRHGRLVMRGVKVCQGLGSHAMGSVQSHQWSMHTWQKFILVHRATFNCVKTIRSKEEHSAFLAS